MNLVLNAFAFNKENCDINRFFSKLLQSIDENFNEIVFLKDFSTKLLLCNALKDIQKVGHQIPYFNLCYNDM